MPDSKTPASTPEGSFDADFRGVHYDFLKDRIPDWFTQASTRRQTVMSAYDLQLPAWYLKATPGQKKTLADTHKRYRETLNKVDTRLCGIKGVFEFAEQPLKEAIKAKFKLDLDVKNTFFARKYGFKGRDDFFGFFVFDQEPDQSLRYEYHGTSLLEAALANFTPEEAKPQPCNNCQIITTWNSYDGDVLPTFEAINSQAIAIAPHEFAELCRTLDLGAQYQKHIKDILEPKTDSERKALEQALDEHQKQQLAMTTETAHQQSDVSTSAYQMLQQLIGNQRRITLDGQPVVYSTLKVFGIDLVGPLLIGPDRASADQTRRVVAYLPNDPQQPFKEYASRGEFMAELRSRLHNADFRRYFSQFVPMRQQGVFVSELSKRYNTTSVDTQADYPLQADPARLPMEETLIEGDLWQQLRQDSISKTYNDARVVAVPTEDEDREARAQRLQSYLDAANSVLNLAAFVVPGLGPIMMTIGAAQMCDDVFEGIEAFEQGEIKEMWAHLASVALNVGFVGTGAAVLPKVQLSSVVDTLKPVTLANGQQKLWNPDITSYRSSITLAPESEADEWGLHTHEGQRLLRVDGDHYEVEQNPATERFRIKHPTRPDAYSPELVHNRQGAWHHEGENPQTWDGPKLMRRLGPLAEGFSDAELEHIRQTSGIDNDVLRRMHAQGESIPAILLETLKKFRAYADAVKISQGSAKGQLSGYLAPLAVELPGWPANKAIEVFTEDDLAGPSIRYGNPDAAAKDVLKVTRQDLLEGRVPERIVAFLSEAEIKALLPNYTPRTPAERAGAVQQQLQAHAARERLRLTQSIYAEQQKSSDPAVALVQRDFSGLPTSMVRELLADATPAERLRLETEKRVPLRIAEGARRLQQQLRLTRAYEGLHLEALANADTETLVLNSLPALPGWTNDLRIEVREGGLEGKLRASVGAPDASERKVLVRDADGRYETRNDRDEHLHGSDDLFNSIQHALPDRHRQAIGLPEVSQGAQLKAKIVEHPLSQDQLRVLLKMQPRRHPFFKAPTRLSGERIGYPLSDHPSTSGVRPSFYERMAVLYPTLLPDEVDEVIGQWGDQANTILTRLEDEYMQLSRALHNWQFSLQVGAPAEERFTRAFGLKHFARVKIIRALLQAWRQEGVADLDNTGQPQGQFIDLSGIDLQGQLNELPPLTAKFDHVTHLDLSSAQIVDNVDGFLSHFMRLRKLNMGNNELVELPEPLGRMTRLTELDLSGNLIKLDAPAVTQLSNLTRLRFLGLEDNPLLTLAPDISRMANLETLLLADTGINAWPTGVFDQPRPRTFFLDMEANRLQVIPDVEPGSAQAEIVARTVISHEPNYISAQDLRRVRDYRLSVGFEPERPYPARGILDSGLWKEGLTEEQWRAKQDTWADLEREPGSEPFFRELRRLSVSADGRSPDARVRVELCRKVWQMVEATAASTALRERLFRMATAPTTCVDANSLLFNTMGVEVLIAQAYELGAQDLIETELVELARGKSRLDELSRIAKERVDELVAEGRHHSEFNEQGEPVPHFDAHGNPLDDIDETEIFFIYPTRLATRLDLPWQSRNMTFGAPEVTAQRIEDAYTRVLGKEQGPLLQERLLEQPFWVEFIRRAYAPEINELRVRGERLLDLQAAQRAWLENDSGVQKIHWRAEIKRLAKLLGKPQNEVKPGEVMSDADYYAEMADIGAKENALIARVTGEIIKRTKLG